MIRRGKYVPGFASVFLVFVLASSVLAQDFSVSPAELEISNLLPGQETEFDITIYNKDDEQHVFVLTTYNPEESQRKQGRADFPDDSWISFPQRVEVKANSGVPVKIKIAVPSNTRWAGEDWEIWLGIAPESGSFLVVKLYVRLLVSTAANTSSGHQIGRVVRGVGLALVLAVLGIYYLRRRKRIQ